MVRNKWKMYKLIVLIVCLISVSIIYKTKFINNVVADNSNVPNYAINKKIVELWIKDNYFSGSINEQIENYNLINKDNIYVKLIRYSADYSNMLRMKLLTSDKPDVFDVGTYDVMKNDKLYPLDNIGINESSIPKNKMLKYKNKVVSVNISGNVVKFAWNKDIFKKCGLNPDKGPKTWQEVLEFSKIIKSKMPKITPFETSFSGYDEFKRSIGEPSVNSDSIYTTFWNYSKGKYDYSSSKYILDFYRTMYNEDLMPKDLEQCDRDRVREDFSNQRTAMLLSFYDDKVKFLSVDPIYFNIGISNIPKIKINDTSNYYFIDDVKRIAVNSMSGNKPEVKKFFDWYAKTCLDTTKVIPYQYKSKYFPEFNPYDNIDNFKFEDKDPTPALNFGYKEVQDLIYSCIRGENSTEGTIANLNKYLNDYCKDVKANDKNFFNSFIGKE